LIETGFISNPTEEQQLIMRSHQKRLAQAIAKGIVQYFKTHPPRGSWLATESKG
jgi:N-acetylmuramoyl-L-alanine amidase